MKTTFKVVLFVFVAAFYSCGKDEVSSTSSSITSSGVISGTISNYGVSPVDSIHFNGSNAIVSSGGKFSSTIAIPKSADLHDFEAPTTGVTISDVNALISELKIVPYSNSVVGELTKTNYSENITSLDGLAFSEFLYCDRDATIKGSYSGDIDIMYGISISGIITFDVKLKKGWNEIVYTVEKMSLITGDATVRVSNTVPSDLKWVFLGQDNAGSASKVKALKSSLK